MSDYLSRLLARHALDGAALAPRPAARFEGVPPASPVPSPPAVEGAAPPPAPGDGAATAAPAPLPAGTIIARPADDPDIPGPLPAGGQPVTAAPPAGATLDGHGVDSDTTAPLPISGLATPVTRATAPPSAGAPPAGDPIVPAPRPAVATPPVSSAQGWPGAPPEVAAMATPALLPRGAPLEAQVAAGDKLATGDQLGPAGPPPAPPAPRAAPHPAVGEVARPVAVRPVPAQAPAIEPRLEREERAARAPDPATGGREEPPTIRVTIGRIEVRAAPAPAARPPRAPAPAGPRVSLADYLRARERGTL